MNNILQIGSIKKKIMVTIEAHDINLSPETFGWLGLDNGIKICVTLSQLHRNSAIASSRFIILECQNTGFGLDEYLKARIRDKRSRLEIYKSEDFSQVLAAVILVNVDADTEFYGLFYAPRPKDDQSVCIVIGRETFGPFTAYEPDIHGGVRRVNVENVSPDLLQHIADSISRGVVCELISEHALNDQTYEVGNRPRETPPSR